MGQLLSGRDIARDINDELRKTVQELEAIAGMPPGLAIITLEEGGAQKRSEVMLHQRAAEKLGISTRSTILPNETSSEELIVEIERASNDPGIHGILVLLPLPEHIDQQAAFAAIAPDKELEGLLEGEDDELIDLDEIDETKKQSSTISAVRMLLESIDFDIPRSRNVFVTEDDIRTNPLVDRLLQVSARVSVPVAVVTVNDPNVRSITREADLILVSTYTPEIVDDTYLKKDAVVIDFFPVMVEERYDAAKGRLVPIMKSGVNVEAALRKAAFVAPSTGGIGPIAVATMMRNLLINFRTILASDECLEEVVA